MRCPRCTYQHPDPALFDAYVTANHWPGPIQTKVIVQEVDALPLPSVPCFVYHRPERSHKYWDGVRWAAVEL